MRINIGGRICTERKARNFSQADLERRCGLARCRISWLEHGRAIPTIETLERIADALEIPLHRLLQEGGGELSDTVPNAHEAGVRREPWRKNGAGLRGELGKHLSRMGEEDKLLLLRVAEKIAGRGSAGHKGPTRRRQPEAPDDGRRENK